MICYFDTSAFLKLVIVTEPGAREAADLWDGATHVMSSVLLYPEGRAALARARRSGRLDDRGLGEAKDDFERLWRGLDVLGVVEGVATRAGALAETSGSADTTRSTSRRPKPSLIPLSSSWQVIEP